MNRISVDKAREILRAFFEDDWRFTNEDLDENGIIVNGEIIHLFLAGQTKSYAIESERGHLFAPKKGFPRMYDVKAGDIVFSYQGGKIKSINVALESTEETYGTREGLRIDCFYSELKKQLDIVPMRPILANYMPFGPTGKLPLRGYIHPLNTHIAKKMMDEIKKLGNGVKPAAKAEKAGKEKKRVTVRFRRIKSGEIELEE